MPFHQIYPRSLTAQSISRFAPAASGVFGISSANKWLYIGETDNIQLTLLSLLDRQGAPDATACAAPNELSRVTLKLGSC